MKEDWLKRIEGIRDTAYANQPMSFDAMTDLIDLVEDIVKHLTSIDGVYEADVAPASTQP